MTLDANRQTGMTLDAKPLGDKWPVTNSGVNIPNMSTTPVTTNLNGGTLNGLPTNTNGINPTNPTNTNIPLTASPIDFTNQTELAKAYIDTQKKLSEKEEQIKQIKHQYENNEELLELKRLKERLRVEDQKKMMVALGTMTDILESRYKNPPPVSLFNKDKLMEKAMTDKDLSSAIEVFAKCAKDLDDELVGTEELKQKNHRLEEELKKKTEEVELHKLNRQWNSQFMGSNNTTPMSQRRFVDEPQTPITGVSAVSAASADSFLSSTVMAKRKKPSGSETIQNQQTVPNTLSTQSSQNSTTHGNIAPMATAMSAASADAPTQSTQQQQLPAYYIPPNKYGDTSIFNQMASEFFKQ
jgi:hypothetical protein